MRYAELRTYLPTQWECKYYPSIKLNLIKLGVAGKQAKKSPQMADVGAIWGRGQHKHRQLSRWFSEGLQGRGRSYFFTAAPSQERDRGEDIAH